jgi:hypothetical protein
MLPLGLSDQGQDFVQHDNTWHIRYPDACRLFSKSQAHSVTHPQLFNFI